MQRAKASMSTSLMYSIYAISSAFSIFSSIKFVLHVRLLNHTLAIVRFPIQMFVVAIQKLLFVGPMPFMAMF